MHWLGWHLTWQDPVALAAVTAILLLVYRQWRHRPVNGCKACPARDRPVRSR